MTIEIKRCYLAIIVVFSLIFVAALSPATGKETAINIVAFSLREAKRVSSDKTVVPSPELKTLGGMGRLLGFIIDENGKDIILIGKKDNNEPILSLDDFAIAIRITAQSGLSGPMVSIEPSGKLDAENQKVLFRGGITNTHIGNILFSADYMVKRIAFEDTENRVKNVKTYATRAQEDFQNNPKRIWDVATRFELVAKNAEIFVFPTERPNIIYIEGCGICVVDNTLYPVTFVDKAARAYITDFNFHWRSFEVAYMEFAKLRSTFCLFEVTKKLVSIMPPEDISFWSNCYKPAEKKTPETVPILSKTLIEGRRRLTLSGGVRLGTIAVRISHGDLSALRDAILLARPSNRTLCWTVNFHRNWLPSASSLTSPEDERIARLFIEGMRLYDEGDYFVSVNRFDEILEVYPESAEVLLAKSLALRDWGLSEYDEKRIEIAYEYLREVTKISPNFVESHYEFANTLRAFGKIDEAIGEYRKAINIQPEYAPPYHGLGLALKDKGYFSGAVAALKNFLKYSDWKEQKEETEKLIANLQAEKKLRKEKKSQDPKTYSNAKHDFVCEYSEGWSVLSRRQLIQKSQGRFSPPEDLVVAFVSPENFDDNVNIQIFQVGQDSLTDEEIEETIKQLDKVYPKNYPNFKKIRAGAITVSGAKGFEYVYSSTRLGAPLEQRVITFVKSKKGVTITFTALKDHFEKLDNTCFQPLLESFRLQ